MAQELRPERWNVGLRISKVYLADCLKMFSERRWHKQKYSPTFKVYEYHSLLCEKREGIMKKPLTFTILLAVFAASLFFAATTFAVKPGEEVNPNGFPSGEHYNLNLNAKKLSYDCTRVEYDEDGNPIYGKVIFIPQDTSSYPGEKVGILMESGKNGPNCTTLEVVDQCAGFDDDPAVLCLPKSEYGYNVYLRAKGEPTENGEMMIFGSLQWVEDENGIPLVFLGTLTDADLKHPLKRPKGKGKIKAAVDISYLFKLQGAICYEEELPADLTNPEAYNNTQCCTPTDTDGDGVNDSYINCSPLVDSECNLGETLLYCTGVFNSDWLFNIEALVKYLWEVKNDGLSAQVRFYPRAAP
jgi:hypothetical protein